jgi:SSS family solute:Na+ symporter
MELKFLDIALFLGFFAVVIGVSLYKSRKEKTGEDFFLASRGLIWPLIGLSLIAANISTEHFVGMAGQGAGDVGLAIASYEWMAAICLVLVGLFFLPKFLRSGIYTIPEYLEYRYNPTARALMAFYTMIIYVGVTIAAVVYSGALTLYTVFDFKLIHAVWLVGGIAALYTIWGGLKAVAWADLFQGSALIFGGVIALFVGLKAIGGVGEFMRVSGHKMHVILPADHDVLPWTALVLGLWIPNFYYWGLNQFITQRALAAKSLKQGQLGIMFAASLKLIIPFVIVVPGIMAPYIYAKMNGIGFVEAGHSADEAYPWLVRTLIGPGFRGFIIAAISGAVISSLASMLNSASTIFTMDLFKRHMKKDASERQLVTIGRITTAVFVILGCVIAGYLVAPKVNPDWGSPEIKGIFTYIQEFQGFLSPGVLAAFAFGLLFKRTPAGAGVSALILNPIIYGLLLIFFGQIAFLNRMAITFVIIIYVMMAFRLLKPLDKPRVMPVRKEFDMKRSPIVVWAGVLVIVLTLILYFIFW